jgi:hypothetical protein
MQTRASFRETVLLLILWSQSVSEYIKYIPGARYIINVPLCVSQYVVKKASCQPCQPEIVVNMSSCFQLTYCNLVRLCVSPSLL